MNNFTARQAREISHDKKIAKKANKIWGREGLAGRLRVERRARMIARAVEPNESKKLLEIGCGTGEITYYLALTKARIIATDIFQDFLDIAAKRIALPNVQFRRLAAENLQDFPACYFDAVYGISILHHLDLGIALDGIYRTLKPGGLMAFSEPNMLNPQIAIQKNAPIIKKMLGDSPDETAFFSWQIRALLKQKKFEDIKAEPFDFLHPALPGFLAKTTESVGRLLEKIPLIKELAGSLFITARKPGQ